MPVLLRPAMLPSRAQGEAAMAGFTRIFVAALELALLPAAASAAVEISAKPTQNMSCSGGICTPTAKKAILNVIDLANMLSSGDVKISSGSLAQDIDVDAKLSWVTNSRLTLDAYRSIAFNRPIDIAGKGALTISTNDGGSGGDFRFFKGGRVKFWDIASNLLINNQHYTLVKSIKQLGSNIRKDDDGFYALAGSVDLSGQVYSASPVHNDFSGVFEGLGNTISNLNIHNNDVHPIGLFTQVDSFALIRDVGLISVSIDAGDAQSAGALVGFLSGGPIIRSSYATGQIFGGTSPFVGGLVGYSDLSAIEDSYAAVAISEDNGAKAVGGLVGYIRGGCSPCLGTIVQSYATGAVAAGSGTFVGGLVGENSGAVILASYATGPVSGGSNAFIGGLVGDNSNSEENGVVHIENSYSTGAVSGGSKAKLGGLVGKDLAHSRIKDSYWDLNTSGISDPSQGAGNITDDPGITGLTTEQFLAGLPKGFKNSIWSEKSTLNGGFPYLIDNPPPK